MATQPLASRSRAGVAGRDDIVFAAALSLIVVAALVFRVLAARPGFLGDELFTYVIANHDSLSEVVDGVRTTENTPPLYYLLAWASLKVTGVPELVRLPSIVAGTATVAVAGLLARRVFDDRAGLAAAALVAISSFAIYYGSEARSYAPAAVAVLVSTLLMLRALESPRRALWAAFAVSAAAAMWFHYTAIFPLAAQFVWALVAHPDRRLQVLAAHLGAALLYAPWLPFAGTYVPISLIAPLAPLSVDRVLAYPIKALLGHPIAELDRAPGIVAVVGLGLLAAVLLLLALQRSKVRRPNLADPRVLLLTMALAAPAGVLLYSLVKTSIWLPRNLLVSAAPAAVLAGGLLGTALKTRLGIALSVAALALLLPAALSTAVGDLARPPYDEVARVIDQRARPGDPIIEGPLFPVEKTLEVPLRRPLATFLRRPHPIYLSDEPEGGWRAAERAGRAFAVYPDVYSGVALYYRPTPPPGSSLVAVDRRSYEGTPGLVYVEYKRRP
jgi:mannosyltransferase